MLNYLLTKAGFRSATPEADLQQESTETENTQAAVVSATSSAKLSGKSTAALNSKVSKTQSTKFSNPASTLAKRQLIREQLAAQLDNDDEKLALEKQDGSQKQPKRLVVQRELPPLASSSSANSGVGSGTDNSPAPGSSTGLGIHKSGRVWKSPKQPLRMSSLSVSKAQRSWDRKMKERMAQQGFKTRAKELKDEKEKERKRVVEVRKEREAIKEEKERYEMMAKKMHAKVSLTRLLIDCNANKTCRKSNGCASASAETSCSRSVKPRSFGFHAYMYTSFFLMIPKF